MKTYLLALLVICSISTHSAFGNEYIKHVAFCSISGDQITFTDAEKKVLPNKIDFQVVMKGISGKNKYSSVEIIGTDVIDVRSAKKSRYASRSNILFSNLTIEESRSLLLNLGAQNIPSLPNGFKFKPVFFKDSISSNGPEWYRRDGGKVRSQVHFPIEEAEGLSYHVNIDCYKSIFNNEY